MRHSIILVVVLVVACGDDHASSSQDAAADALPPPALVWSPCPIVSGGTGSGAECGQAEVPLDWAQPAGPRIQSFVKRIGRVDAPLQLWMLNGGPGASGADFEPLAEPLSADGSIVIYLPDHRGTGRSTRLGCAAEADASPGGFYILDDEWAACAAEVAATHETKLAGFNTTQAAHDLEWLIDQTQRPGQAINVWGGSYGTRWAQRYLQLRPDQASSVTLLGVVTATRTMTDYDQIYDDVGAAFLARCSENAFCASRLGPNAATRARAIWDSIDSGHCAAAQLDKRMLKTFFAALLLSYWYERALIPATLARIERCSTSDVAALRYLSAVLSQPSSPTTSDRLHSNLLGLNISVNEFWPADAPSIESLRAIDERAIVSFGSAVRTSERAASWPKYALDDHAGRYPATDLPVLIINGEFDPATPLAHAHEVASHYTRPNQRLVVGPDATHAFATPTAAGYECFLALMIQFARTPTVPVSCANDILPMDFRGTAELGAYFGTTDLWDGGPSVLPVAPPATVEEIRRHMALRW
jgi:pimeloyl-ACP methyl ester carboxylesterase